MNDKKNIIIIVLVIIICIFIIGYFITNFKDSHNPNDDEVTNENDIPGYIEEIDGDMVTHKVLLPLGTKIYYNNKEVNFDILEKEVKRYNQKENYEPIQQLYSFKLPANTKEIKVTLNGVEGKLNFFLYPDEKLGEEVSFDIEAGKSIGDKKIIDVLKVYNDILFYLDFHESDYSNYMTKNVYDDIVINDKDRYLRIDVDQSFEYDTFEEFKKDITAPTDKSIWGSFYDKDHFFITSYNIVPDIGNALTHVPLFLVKENDSWRIVKRGVSNGSQ